MEKKVSIYDIAKYLSISPASVSYVINGIDKVSSETKKRVLQAIDELGYVRDNIARTLSTGKSQLIGLFLPTKEIAQAFRENPFYSEYLGGIQEGISSFDYDVIISGEERSEHFIPWAKSRGLDGVIVLGKFPKSMVDDIRNLNIPVVLSDVYEEYVSGISGVRINDFKGMYEATKYLIDNGHKKIGFVGSRYLSQVDNKRFEGYIAALKEADLEINEQFYYDTLSTFEKGANIALEILARNNVTAVVCCSDALAIGIIKKYHEVGKEIPDDLSIIGFDDIRDAQYVNPTLTTLHQDISLKGIRASQIIIDKINNKNDAATIEVIEPKLVIRNSVKNIKN